ncbi:MAG: DNA repair protein RecO [Oligoflexia bacterium]|nr:DNA repair protein RecO [Oligoflexia bacterium]
MEQKKDLAIVLRSVPYEERHRIVTALTEQHGQVSAMARNSIQSRRFGGTLDVFAASEWTFVEKPGAELCRLDEARIRRSYEGLRNDFERLSMASVFNELMLRLAPKQQACPELFRLHSNALAALEEAPKEGAVSAAPLLQAAEPSPAASDRPPVWKHDLALLNGYLAKLLHWSGSQPQLLTCRGCDTSIERVDPAVPLSARVADAGWICANCRSSEVRHVQGRAGESFHHAMLRIMPMAILDFHVSLVLPIRQVPLAAQASREEHQELFRFLEALFIYHLPGFDQKPLKGIRFLGLESSVQPQEGPPR